MQTAAALQKKEQNKSEESASPHQVDTLVYLKEKHGPEADVPLFLQRIATSSLAMPPPARRQPGEEDSEQLIRTKPITAFVQRDVLEDEGCIAQDNSGSPSIQRQPLEEQKEDIIDHPGAPQFQRQPDDEEHAENEELPVFPKLTIGAPDDKYEQEADRVADKVLRMPDDEVQRKPT